MKDQNGNEYDEGAVYAPYIPLYVAEPILEMPTTHNYTEKLEKLLNILNAILLVSKGPTVDDRSMVLEDIHYIKILIGKQKYDLKITKDEMKVCNSLWVSRSKLLKKYTSIKTDNGQVMQLADIQSSNLCS